MTRFCPKNFESSFVAFMNIPSYVISLDCATAFDQKGGDSMRKLRMTPLVAFQTVKEIGRPSPSWRVRGGVANADHQGYNDCIMIMAGHEQEYNRIRTDKTKTHLTISLDASSIMGIDFKVRAGDYKPAGLALFQCNL